MKVGILTFHRAYNYGAFLQAFALKHFLESQGHQVCFIDYWPIEHQNFYNLFNKNALLSPKKFIRECLLAIHRFFQYNAIKRCQYSFLKLPKRPIFSNPEQLSSLNLDAIVYGSDQIWWKNRLNLDGFDPAYWGDYVKKTIQKIAYAPSMGIINISDKDKTFIIEHLNYFKAISVREIQLANTLQTICNKNYPVVLDPTLLINPNIWKKLCKPTHKGKYILLFKVLNDPSVNGIAKDFSKKTNLPIIEIQGHIHSYKHVGKCFMSQNPLNFISLVNEAEYIISTSFHGVAFSIIFNKQFYALGMGNNSDRVNSLLQQLGLEERMISTPTINNITPIDYDPVNKKIDSLRKQSESFLINSLNFIIP